MKKQHVSSLIHLGRRGILKLAQVEGPAQAVSRYGFVHFNPYAVGSRNFSLFHSLRTGFP